MSVSTVSDKAYFQFLDVTVQIECEQKYAEAFELIQKDFANFKIENINSASVDIHILIGGPATPKKLLLPFIMTAKWAAFGWWKQRSVYYSDQSVCHIQHKENQIKIQIHSAGQTRAREILYFALLSTVGELLEKKGYHRLHAAAIQASSESSTVILFGLSGSGKSSLALQAIDEGMKILGDEVLFCKDDNIFSFPLNIAASENNSLTLNRKSDFKFQHSKFSKEKYLFTIPKAQIPHEAKIAKVALLQSDSHQWITDELSFWDYAGFVFTVTLGLHLPQMTEYFLRADNFHFLIELFFRRLFFALKLIRYYPFFDFHTGKDPKLNYKVFKEEFLISK